MRRTSVSFAHGSAHLSASVGWATVGSREWKKRLADRSLSRDSNCPLHVWLPRLTQPMYQVSCIAPHHKFALKITRALSFPMPSDPERWRFLADHGLTLHTDGGDDGYMVHWCRTAGPGEPPQFYPVSNGRTAEEAIDRAIECYNRKHRISATSAVSDSQVVTLTVRGWVS